MEEQTSLLEAQYDVRQKMKGNCNQLQIATVDEGDTLEVEISNQTQFITGNPPDVTVAMLKQSRQIIQDVSRQEINLLLLENKNDLINIVKEYYQKTITSFENVLEHDLKPNINQEEQYCSKVEMQMCNNETLVNKIKMALDATERKYSDIQTEREHLQQELNSREKTLKIFLNKKSAILTEYNKSIDLEKRKLFDDTAAHWSNIAKIEDDLNSTIKGNSIKTDLHKTLNENVMNLIVGEIDSRNKDLSDLLDKKVKLKEIVLMKDNYKLRLDTNETQIKIINQLMSNKESNRNKLCVLREELAEFEKENELLRMRISDIQQTIVNFEEILVSLQTLKQKNYYNMANKNEQEKALFVETTKLTTVQTKHDKNYKHLVEEVKFYNELEDNIKSCKSQLLGVKQQFEMAKVELADNFNDLNVKYEKENEYKDLMSKKVESYRTENEKELNLKLTKIDQKKVSIDKIKEEYEKNVQLVDASVRLKDKLQKEKTEIENECDIKHSEMYGTNNALIGNVKGILKSPSRFKQVKFQGLSDISSDPPSQVSSETFDVNTFREKFKKSNIKKDTTCGKKRKHFLDSP